MKFFTKKEFKGVVIILLTIFAISLLNFRFALRRSRDSQRREDLGRIYNALGKYQAEFGFFPLSSSEGEIKACKPDKYEEEIGKFSEGPAFDLEGYLNFLKACQWGVDALTDINDESHQPYLDRIPLDPSWEKGSAYLYLSNGRRFQVYTHLEGGETEIGFDEAIARRGLKCGEAICNFGRAYSVTPLDKSLEEYENELMIKNQK